MANRTYFRKIRVLRYLTGYRIKYIRNGDIYKLSSYWLLLFAEAGGDITAMKNRIKELRRSQGLTLQRLADQIGTTPQQINRLERGDRRLTTEWMERVAAGLEVHPTELIADEADIALRSGRGSPGGSTDHSSGSGLRARDIPIHGNIDLPVLGTARGGSDALMFNDGEVVERVTRPSLLAGARQAYAVYMTGDSMEPRYHALELLYVNPARPITSGCYIVLQKANGEAIVKRFTRRSDDVVVLEQLNPPVGIQVPAEEVAAIHRIVGSVEHA